MDLAGFEVSVALGSSDGVGEPDGVRALVGSVLGDSSGSVACAAGVPSLWNRRGERDRNSRPLESTEVAWADAVAAAAGLVMGEADEGLPCVLVRGLRWSAPDVPALDLVRPIGEDLFR